MDVSAEAGLARPAPTPARGWACWLVDVNGDGKPDIYVANDTTDKFLYLNRSTPGKIQLRGGRADQRQRPGTTAAAPTAAWAWTPATTTAAAGRRCGSPTTRTSCTACTATTSGPGGASSTTRPSEAGLAARRQRYVGWGTAFLDVDLDGWEDLFIVNGHAIRHHSEHRGRPQAAARAVSQPRRQVQGRQPADRQLPRQGPPGPRRGLRRPGQRRPHRPGHQPHQRAGDDPARHRRPGPPLAGRAARRPRTTPTWWGPRWSCRRASGP